MNALEEQVILLDPQMALATVTEFLDEIHYQWLHYGPKGPDGQPGNAGQQQATAINRMLEALDVNDIRSYPSRASSLGEAPTVKVEEGQPSRGVPITPKEKMTSLTLDEKHLQVRKRGGVDLLGECRIARHICLDETRILSIIFVVNVEEQQSFIKWHETMPPLSIT